MLTKSLIKALTVGIEEGIDTDNMTVVGLIDLLIWMASYSRMSCMAAFKVI